MKEKKRITDSKMNRFKSIMAAMGSQLKDLKGLGKGKITMKEMYHSGTKS